MATIDLNDAYFHIDILPQHRPFLCFAVGQVHLQYKALPFGLSMAPWVFTKTMVVVTAHLRLQGIIIFPYIDDWLVVADSTHHFNTDLDVILTLRSDLGLQVNYKKSHLTPSTTVQFIGAVLDSTSVRAFLP